MTKRRISAFAAHILISAFVVSISTDKQMSRLVTKPTKWHMRPAKTLISLGITKTDQPSSLCAQWLAKDPSFLHTDSEDSDQTGWMPRLIWVFAGRTCHYVGFVTRRLKFGCWFWFWRFLSYHSNCFNSHKYCILPASCISRVMFSDREPL